MKYIDVRDPIAWVLIVAVVVLFVMFITSA